MTHRRQSGVNALGVQYYPTSMRAAGMGWALGIGRFGSVTGPLFGGLFLAHGWGGQSVFFGAAGAGVLATLAVWLLHWRAAPGSSSNGKLDMAIESSH